MDSLLMTQTTRPAKVRAQDTSIKRYFSGFARATFERIRSLNRYNKLLMQDALNPISGPNEARIASDNLATVDSSTPIARVKPDQSVDGFLRQVKAKDPGQLEFHQAVEEVALSLWPYIERHPEYQNAGLLERMVEPERAVSFRVVWSDDAGNVQVNRGYRVQMNSAIGPYKGGLRFHPSVNLGILKFLAFEQTFKNALTTLPMGGGKGGADFDPKGKSDGEIMRFCQSFIAELFRHIGPDTDVPAGDIGVGAREIGYMFGYYKKLANQFTGVLTGKSLSYGGSLVRPEATGYGLLYFVEDMLHSRNTTIDGKRIAISGSGNVAQFAAEKAIELGGIVVSLSDSGGTVWFPEGITAEQLVAVKSWKNERRGRLNAFAMEFDLTYFQGRSPWHLPCEMALPCATQNELGEADAVAMLENGCQCVAEGANMPCTPEAVHLFQTAKILYGPGKAANAGGVATSGLEMSQNSVRLSWTFEEVDSRLRAIVRSIHHSCVDFGGEKDGFVDYVKGANIAGFRKVADAMLSQGVC